MMKDRKTLWIFLIPLLLYLLGVGAYLLSERLGRAPEPSIQQIREGADLWRAEDHPVDLNSAGAEDLMVLPGIGEVKAGRILQYRLEVGGFSSVEELLRIEGIGLKELKQLRPYVCVHESEFESEFESESESAFESVCETVCAEE